MTKEETLQIAVADYIRLQYPRVLFCHIANERKAHVYRKMNGKSYSPNGQKLKKMGVQAGMPDVMVFYQRELVMDGINGTYSGVAIELKVKPNKPTEKQLDVLKKLHHQGWLTAVCYTFDEAKEVIDKYLG